MGTFILNHVVHYIARTCGLQGERAQSFEPHAAVQPLRLLTADKRPPQRASFRCVGTRLTGSFAATRSGQRMTTQGATAPRRLGGERSFKRCPLVCCRCMAVLAGGLSPQTKFAGAVRVYRSEPRGLWQQGERCLLGMAFSEITAAPRDDLEASWQCLAALRRTEAACADQAKAGSRNAHGVCVLRPYKRRGQFIPGEKVPRLQMS